MATVATVPLASSAGWTAPPPPEEPLSYPILFTRLEAEAEESAVQNKKKDNNGDGAATAAVSVDLPLDRAVTIFSALHWLVPVYELAGWIPRQPRAHEMRGTAAAEEGKGSDSNNIKGSSGSSSGVANMSEDVRSALELLSLFKPFYTINSKLIPKHEEPYHCVESISFPTPKGPRTVTRSKVEGDYRAVHQPSFAPQSGEKTSVSATTVTNSTAYFSLLPGHNHFLVYYEDRSKLVHFNYVQLDMLRFAWVVVKELMGGNDGGGSGGAPVSGNALGSSVFNLTDGTITGCARRDLKKNNINASPAAVASASTDKSGETDVAKAGSKGSGGAGGGASAPAVGRGGGNARLNQGTSGNVITGPRKDVIEIKQEMHRKRFLKEELEEECQRRWPHTPVAKSCIFTAEEKAEAELPPEVLEQMGVASKNMRNNNNKPRKGPKYYLGMVELPLLNKKGGVARFKATRWWNTRRDADSASAEVAISALRNTKM